jgi:hypothetical protein
MFPSTFSIVRERRKYSRCRSSAAGCELRRQRQ